VEEDLSGDIYDDTYFKAYLDTQQETAEGADGDGAVKAGRVLERQKRRLNRDRNSQELRKRGDQAKWALAKTTFLDIKKAELSAVESEIAALESERPVFAPVNIVISIKEQISKPENTFLMTAADILEGSKQGIKEVIVSNVTQEGRERQRQEELDALSRRSTLVLAALEARRLAQEREVAFKSLPAGASELEVLNSRHSLEAAKVQANIAALKADMSPPFRDVFGGGN
jgi:hypothetical protein